MEKASLYSKLVAKVSVKHIVHPRYSNHPTPLPSSPGTGQGFIRGWGRGVDWLSSHSPMGFNCRQEQLQKLIEILLCKDSRHFVFIGYALNWHKN